MDILSAATMLFLIMDPLGNLPIVLSILKHIDPKRRRKVLIRELIFALLILMLFLFAGQSILFFARTAGNLEYLWWHHLIYHRN